MVTALMIAGPVITGPLMTGPLTAGGTDIWGIVVPGYIGAVGGLISTVIGALALVQPIRNRSGVTSIAAALSNSRDPAEALLPHTRAAGATGALSPVTWDLVRTSRGEYSLVNRSSATAARLVGITQLGGAAELQFTGAIPADVPAGGRVPVRVRRSLTSGTVRAFMVMWTESGDEPQSAVLFG